MRFICPLILVDDIAVSRRFYEHVLGQEVRHDFGENVIFEGGFSIHLKSHFSALTGIRTCEMSSRPRNMELYFEEDDIQDFARRLKECGVERVHPLAEQPWGQRVVRFYDPDGHIVEAGESMQSVVRRLLAQGMTAEQAARRTSMPLEFVRDCQNETDGG